MPFKALMGTIKIWEACACRGNMGTIKGFSNIYCSGGWQQLGIGRDQWPFEEVPRGALGLRELYIRRHTEVHQMKFDDPLSAIYHLNPAEATPSRLMLDRNCIWVCQGPVAKKLSVDWPEAEVVETHRNHGARITCMRHKSSLLVSSSKDSKVKIWDTVAPSSGSSSCVGSTHINSSGPPIAMKCHESLCYMATGSEVTAIDLRTMKKASVLALHNHRILSCEMLPSEWLICTGTKNKALLWDIRKAQELPNTVTEMQSDGPVTLLHLDRYKVVTGVPSDGQVHVWETRTGELLNTLSCGEPARSGGRITVSAMALDGCRMVMAGSSPEGSVLHYRDFLRSSTPIPLAGEEVSRFWRPRQFGENDDENEDEDYY
ncbi:hypothetical protein PAHAL_5G502500 [Panicum hallii]|uniref:Uncharacterized protein n=1 Tax=Panicum hallii TaxID=206008 RepID=A0A2S3HYG3_9POAL|nr:hypothetical protein PAHAL_5G502500 [Panicum hallii]